MSLILKTYEILNDQQEIVLVLCAWNRSHAIVSAMELLDCAPSSITVRTMDEWSCQPQATSAYHNHAS